MRSANIGLWDWDLITNEVFFSSEWKNQIGYAENEIPNRFEEWESRVHPDEREGVLQSISSYLANPQGQYQVKFRFRHRDGSYRWIYAQGDVLKNAEGKSVRMLGSHIDITERRRAEDRFRLAIDAAPTGMILVDQRGTIVLVNNRVENLFGYNREELLGLSIEVIVPERFRGHHPELRGGFFADPKARPMGMGRDLYGLRKNGTEVPIEIALNPLEMAEGKFVLSSIVDITERKRAALEIQQNREELEKFVEFAPASIAMLDRNMRYVVASRRWRHDCAMDQQSVVGRSHYEVLPALPESWKEAHRRGLAGETLKAEDEWVALDGRTRIIRWEIHPWGDSETSTGGIIVFMEDVTERKRAESALRESEERFRVALKNSPIAVFNQDRDLRYTWMYNPQLEGKATDYLGKTVNETFGPDEGERVAQIRRRVLETGTGVRDEVHRTVDGRERYFDTTIEPLLRHP